MVRDEVAPKIVPFDVAAETLGVSRTTLWRRVRTGRFQTVPTGRRLGNGRPEVGLVLLGIALERARAARQDQDRGRSPAVPEVRPDAQPQLPARVPGPGAEFPAGPEAGERRIDANGVPLLADGRPDTVLMRAVGQVARVREYERRRRAVATLLERMAGVQHGERCVVWREVAGDFGMSPRRLRQLVSAFKAAGPAALVPSPSRRRGGTGIPDEVKQAIRGSCLTQQQASAAQIFREVVLPLCAEIGIAAPSEKTIRRFLARNILPIEAIYFREGPRAFEAKCAPKVKRTTPSPGQIWSVDNRLADTMVLDGGKACRPWVTCVWDCGSAGLIGWRISRMPNAAIIASALRSAIEAVGVPRIINRDNGKDFCAGRLGGKAARLLNPRTKDVKGRSSWPSAMAPEVEQGLFDQLGVQLITSLPFRAWSKPAESFFAAFQRVAGENLTLGWTGRDARRKPEALKQLIRDGKLLTLDEYGDAFGLLARRWNEERVVGERTAPPAELLRNAGLRRVDPRELAFMVQSHGRRRVRGHAVVLDGERWIAHELAIHSGRDLECRWDFEAGQAFAYADGTAIVLRRDVPAVWGEFGQANLDAQRARRAQAEHLADVRSQVRGAPFADPGGSVATAGRRLRIEAAAAGAAEQRAALGEAEEAAARRYPESGLTAYDFDPELLRLRVIQHSLQMEAGGLSEEGREALLALVAQAVAADRLDGAAARDKALRAVHEQLRAAPLLGTLPAACRELRRPFVALGMAGPDGMVLPIPGSRRARVLKEARATKAERSRLDVQLNAMVLESAYCELQDLDALRQRPGASAADLRNGDEWEHDLRRRLAGVQRLDGAEPRHVQALAQAGLLSEWLGAEVGKWSRAAVRVGRVG